MALPAGNEFVEAVMKHLKAKGATDLARKMDWDLNSPSLIAKWRKGLSEPSYEPVMQMLEKCGWLNMSADVPAAEEKPPDLQAKILEGVTELLAGQERLLERAGLGVKPAPARTAAGRPAKKAAP